MDNLLKLINTLGKHLEEEITIRQLSIESKVPYTTAHRVILENKDIFIINQKGNIKLCSLNKEDDIVQSYLIISEKKQANEFLKRNEFFSILQNSLPKGDYSLILFGSRAEGKERSKSDVDICVINSTGKKDIDFSKFELLYKLEVNALFFSKKEFLAMKQEDNHNIFDEIVKKHIILHGEKYFWEVV